MTDDEPDQPATPPHNPDQSTTQQPAVPQPATPQPAVPQPRKRGRPRKEITFNERQEILQLRSFYGTRRIAQRMGLTRRLVQQIIDELSPSPVETPTESKLAPFLDEIAAKIRQDLTTSRILRELKADGYLGGRTILAEKVHQLRAELTMSTPRHPTTKRRFETGPGIEMQIDWTPYEVTIAGRPVKVRVLGCLLCYSRKLFIRCYRDERQSTLLEGLASAFLYFEGVTQRLVLDNMATAVLGRIGPARKPLWHDTFRDFARHYGVDPFACRVRDPDRKGKQEKAFRLVQDDFLKGTDFASWDDLHERCPVWLDGTPDVANQRVHGTTRRVPNQVWADEERALLIRLPEARFPVHESGARIVDRDATLAIRGTRYTVPAVLAGRSVGVRLFAEHFEVLDPQGRVAMSRIYVPDEQKGQLVIDQSHYASLPRRGPGLGRADGGERLDEAFLRRFPDLLSLVDGLKLRMKTLAPIHLRALLRLSDRFGEPAFRAAAGRAQHYRRFDAGAVERILERQARPLPDADAVAPLSGHGPTILGEVEPPSFDAFDHLDATSSSVINPLDSEEDDSEENHTEDDDSEEDDHGA
jgi:transposase